jgi:hydrogenase maturation protein HypF
MAERHGETPPRFGGWSIENGCLDLSPLLAVLADEKNPGFGAALFHATLAAALTDWMASSAPANATVVAGGGCLQNQVLGRALRAGLSGAGLRLLEARRIPPNDAGIALGQTWIAQHRL